VFDNVGGLERTQQRHPRLGGHDADKFSEFPTVEAGDLIQIISRRAFAPIFPKQFVDELQQAAQLYLSGHAISRYREARPGIDCLISPIRNARLLNIEY